MGRGGYRHVKRVGGVKDRVEKGYKDFESFILASELTHSNWFQRLDRCEKSVLVNIFFKRVLNFFLSSTYFHIILPQQNRRLC